jgi:hypothetical protein
MSFYRIYPTADTYITNKIRDQYTLQRATGSNLGSCPVLKIFKITSSFPNDEVELARTLIKFDITALSRKSF